MTRHRNDAAPARNAVHGKLNRNGYGYIQRLGWLGSLNLVRKDLNPPHTPAPNLSKPRHGPNGQPLGFERLAVWHMSRFRGIRRPRRIPRIRDMDLGGQPLETETWAKWPTYRNRDKVCTTRDRPFNQDCNVASNTHLGAHSCSKPPKA